MCHRRFTDVTNVRLGFKRLVVGVTAWCSRTTLELPVLPTQLRCELRTALKDKTRWLEQRNPPRLTKAEPEILTCNISGGLCVSVCWNRHRVTATRKNAVFTGTGSRTPNTPHGDGRLERHRNPSEMVKRLKEGIFRHQNRSSEPLSRWTLGCIMSAPEKLIKRERDTFSLCLG